MPTDLQTPSPASANNAEEQLCFHCGEVLNLKPVNAYGKRFCCEGCKMVYGLLRQADLCGYYQLSHHPGISQTKPVRKGKFAFLDLPHVASKLLEFDVEGQCRVTFYLPQMHCNSCLWLLEHLAQLNPAIIYSRVNFERKELSVMYYKHQLSLRQLAELLASVGYEPYLSLQSLAPANRKAFAPAAMMKLGVAGFCFSNIMLLSFPEYLGLSHLSDTSFLLPVFRYICMALSIPVLFYSASGFFISGFNALRRSYLNIDAPVAAALLITFLRSVYEIITNTGSGYLDSMSGIVFFLLMARMLQQISRHKLFFDRTYKAYFPMAVNRKTQNGEEPVTLADLKTGDEIVIYADEIVPADGILLYGNAKLDYSFVTGESREVKAGVGELVYAGAKQLYHAITLRVVKPVNQSYLTSLWQQHNGKDVAAEEQIWIDAVAKKFIIVLFILSASAAVYWFINDPSLILSAITAALIVACPCALLLCNSFTNAHVLKMLQLAGLYLKNSKSIEKLYNCTELVADKTGTLTSAVDIELMERNKVLPDERSILRSLASASHHPLSRALAARYKHAPLLPVEDAAETPGEGIEAWVGNKYVRLGNASFTQCPVTGAALTYRINNSCGSFDGVHPLRKGIPYMLSQFKLVMPVTILSGDNGHDASLLKQLLPNAIAMRFNYRPLEKLHFILQRQQQGKRVLMLGDGLNDAGALQAAEAGIAVAENTNAFTPGSDGIILAENLAQLPFLLGFIRLSRWVVYLCFAFSLLYNIVGLWYAFSGKLTPLIAAVLMPCSTLTIMLISYCGIRIAYSMQVSRFRNMT